METSCAPCSQSPVFTIFQGDSKTLPLKALFADTLDPLDLTSCTEILVPLPNADGTFTVLKYSLSQVVIASPAVLGQFSVPISSVNSLLLNPGVLQNLDVTFTITGSGPGTGTFTVRYYACFSVLEVD
jgi:hypothetical protein